MIPPLPPTIAEKSEVGLFYERLYETLRKTEGREINLIVLGFADFMGLKLIMSELLASAGFYSEFQQKLLEDTSRTTLSFGPYTFIRCEDVETGIMPIYLEDYGW